MFFYFLGRIAHDCNVLFAKEEQKNECIGESEKTMTTYKNKNMFVFVSLPAKALHLHLKHPTKKSEASHCGATVAVHLLLCVALLTQKHISRTFKERTVCTFAE